MASQVEVDPQETREWLEALDAVVASDGPQRAQFLLERVVGHAQLSGRRTGARGHDAVPEHDPAAGRASSSGGRGARAASTQSIVRWNAIATILNANKTSSELGGHIASYQSAAVLYETGFNHFWNAPSDKHGGDLVFMQGHSSPGVYARAFLEGRIPEEQMRKFRMEVGGGGLSSYPHPWLMPDFWQFPTVSMGLGPLMAIYQARFMKYLQGRGLAETAGRKVWAFMGDGEMDEPESLGAISMAGRETPRQPDLRHQLQPAAPRRPGARQRQDHPGARDQLPRRGLERHQDHLGLALGPAARRRTTRATCSRA